MGGRCARGRTVVVFLDESDHFLKAVWLRKGKVG